MTFEEVWSRLSCSRHFVIVVVVSATFQHQLETIIDIYMTSEMNVNTCDARVEREHMLIA